MVGVPRTTLEGWENNTSIDESVITCTPLDLRIKVGKAEHHAKLFLLTSGCAGSGLQISADLPFFLNSFHRVRGLVSLPGSQGLEFMHFIGIDILHNAANLSSIDCCSGARS